ncbi:MAG TPA: DNA alkylation repair protein, partial [Paenisporosarcina sp.]|nr:DNA alkylation repair protein [Paenisporosarcina sp.]
GWSCYCWLLGNRPDAEFNTSKLSSMLDQVEMTIHNSPDRTKSAMNNFIYTVGVSYLPLHDKAVETAKNVGPVEIRQGTKKRSILLASESIQKHIDSRPLGFKRKHVRC